MVHCINFILELGGNSHTHKQYSRSKQYKRQSIAHRSISYNVSKPQQHQYKMLRVVINCEPDLFLHMQLFLAKLKWLCKAGSRTKLYTHDCRSHSIIMLFFLVSLHGLSTACILQTFGERTKSPKKKKPDPTQAHSSKQQNSPN